MIGEKVKHKLFGIGVIKAFENNYMTVEFSTKTIRLIYPSAFEDILTALDDDLQIKIKNELQTLAEEENNKLNEKVQRLRKGTVIEETSKSRKKSLDEMFSDDYNVTHLSRNPILTYSQVESQYHIKISGFGRGINPTDTSVVLISSIGKSDGSFVYHDKWTADGDYIYCGEGKTGDQTLTRGNLAIVEAKKAGKDIHLFVKFSPKEYYYQGVFELVDYWHEDERDESGSVRKEYKFRLKKV